MDLRRYSHRGYERRLFPDLRHRPCSRPGCQRLGLVHHRGGGHRAGLVPDLDTAETGSDKSDKARRLIESIKENASGMVDNAKKRNLLQAVNAYMKRYSPPYIPRVDVIEVYLDPDRRVLSIEQIEGAVTGNTKLRRKRR